MELHNPSMTGGTNIDRPGPNQVIYVSPTYDMRFIGRYCTIRGKRSGGYVVKGALNERYNYESGFIRFVEKRLKPGFTKEQLQRACYRIFMELTYRETYETQKFTGKEVMDSFRQKILEKEHNAVQKQKNDADIYIDFNSFLDSYHL